MADALGDRSHAPPPPDRRVDVVVFVGTFPKYSETFILAELLALERMGARLHVIAFGRITEAVVQEDVARLQAPVAYLPDPASSTGSSAARAAHIRLLRTHGLGYLAALRRLSGSPGYSRKRLAEAATLADRLIDLGTPPVYVHFGGKTATVTRFATEMAGSSYALSAHAVDVWTTPPDELRAAVHAAEAVHTCSDEARQYVETLADSRTPVRLLHHGVHIPPAPRRIADDAPVTVLSVGRLTAKKGHATLLEAAALLAARGIDFTLRLAGEGPDWSALQRQVHHLDLADRVVFLGPLVADELETEFNRAAVFALACRVTADGDRDGLANAFQEAMARGIPVVGTTLPGIVELVGPDGLLVAQDDAAGLAAALERLIVDPGLRGELGARARGRVQARFDRSALMPAVHESLVQAGIIRRGSARLGE